MKKGVHQLADVFLKIAKAPQSGIGVHPDLSGLRSDKLSHSETILFWEF
jgi:hypothetical protein